MAQIKPSTRMQPRSTLFSIAFLLVFFGIAGSIVGTIVGNALATSRGWHKEAAHKVFIQWADAQKIRIKEGSVICSRSLGDRGILCQFHEEGKDFVQRAFCPGWPNLLGEDTCELGTRASAVDLYE